MDLKKYIRDIPDFPKPGILFHDVTTLFKEAKALAYVLDCFYEKYCNENIDYIMAVKARGFILGGALAYKLNAGFVPIRKPGKLPAKVIFEEYQLEYGNDRVEIHEDAITKGSRVLIIDDLVATGGTLVAGIRLAQRLGAEIAAVASIIDMPDLGGRDMLKDYNYFYLIEYLGE